MMPLGGMAPQAQRQLAAWQAIADEWAYVYTDRTWRCIPCGKGIALAEDESGRLYHYTQEQFTALIVLHLRNHHADLDPN